MISKNIEICIREGLDSRPVAVFVQVASKYESAIYVEWENKKINAKSIMGMMTLGLAAGQSIKVTADGEDEAEAIQNIETYLGTSK